MKYNFNKNWTFRRECEDECTELTLPHDAMQGEKRSADGPGGTSMAYFHGDKYVYEKGFFADDDWSDKCATLEFEGVYKNAQVYINGKLAGGRPYGYIPFYIPLDGLLNYGETNTVKVVVDASLLPCSRWYSGAGIYRPVWLHIQPKTHIEIEGVRITTLSVSPSTIRVESRHNGGEARVEILENGCVISTATGNKVDITIPNAKLWSDETPFLYSCKVSLTHQGKEIDSLEQSFGIRKIEWSTNGLFINGKETLLRGGCIHSDNGILGSRVFNESEERRIRILKEQGFNAVRISHNPASKATLEACDKLGMYVMDETWDMWYSKKKPHDYSFDFMDNYKEDLNALISRDYNHPSVIMYSLGNEVTEPAEEKGVELLKEMVALVHELDDTRPTTAGINLTLLLMSKMNIASEEKMSEAAPKLDDKESSERFNAMTSMFGKQMTMAANSEQADTLASPCLDALDIAGYNYATGRYEMEAELHPKRIIVGAETYPQDIYDNWELVKKLPYVIGDFMWTAWDYLGEVGIGAWAYSEDGVSFDKPYPWLLADVGAIDILGNAGAQAGYNKVVWGIQSEPYVGVQPVNHQGIVPAKAIWRGTNALPSWAWNNCDGNDAIVEVYANAKTVELLLNGKSVGKQTVEACKATFETKYESGKLEAISYDASGKVIGKSSLESASGDVKVCLHSDTTTAFADDIIYIDISLKGENGIVESNVDTLLEIKVNGGELLAFGSANPRTEENYTDGKFTSYYGYAQAVVRANQLSNDVCVTVKGNGINTAKLIIPVK